MKTNKISAFLLAGAMFLSGSSIVMGNYSQNNYENNFQNTRNWVSPYDVFQVGSSNFIHNVSAVHVPGTQGTYAFSSSLIREVSGYHNMGTIVLVHHLNRLLYTSSATNGNNTNSAIATVNGAYLASGYIVTGIASIIDLQTGRSHINEIRLPLSEAGRTDENHNNEFFIQFQEAFETNGMIQAMNADGVSGYVYAREVVGDLNTITNDIRFVNLYDEDGVTVIGEFQIG